MLRTIKLFTKGKIVKDVKALVLFIKPKLGFNPTRLDRFIIELEMEEAQKIKLFGLVKKGFSVFISAEEEAAMENLGQLIDLTWERHNEPFLRELRKAITNNLNGRVDVQKIGLQTKLADIQLGHNVSQEIGGMLNRIEVIHDLEELFQVNLENDKLVQLKNVAGLVDAFRTAMA